MVVMWTVELHGGPFHGVTDGTDAEPRPVLFAFRCDDPVCVAHLTFDVDRVPIERATAYRLEERDDDEHRAVYVVGDDAPVAGISIEEEALAGISASSRCRCVLPPWRMRGV